MGEKSRIVEGKLQVACPSCGKTNAVPIGRSSMAGMRILQDCPGCPDTPLEVDDASFPELVSNRPFRSSWTSGLHGADPAG